MLKVERTDSEIIIRLPADLAIDDIQRLLDYISYKQSIKDSQATQDQIDELAREVNKDWWERNKDRFPDL